MLNFDHNATSPLLPQARDAWLEAAADFPGNPSSPHRLGSRADTALNLARERLAALLLCDPLDIVWTSGATESNNMVLHHFARALPARSEVWLSPIEHPSVLEAARHYFPRRLRWIPVTPGGIIDLGWLKTRISRPRPGLVAVMAANNETGVLQPWQDVMLLCRKWKVPFFCDATQWTGKLPARGLGECDFVSGSAHKFGGPRGAGFLKCARGGWVHPLLRGGKQEDGRRAGTENVAGVAAMLAALKLRENAMAEGRQKPRLTWRDAFIRKLQEALPSVEIIGADQARLWNTVTVLVPEEDPQRRWIVKLDKLGIAVSTGSACASGREQPSHVLEAMGYSSAQTGRVLRFSSGWETTEEEWGALLDALAKVYEGMREENV